MKTEGDKDALDEILLDLQNDLKLLWRGFVTDSIDSPRDHAKAKINKLIQAERADAIKSYKKILKLEKGL